MVLDIKGQTGSSPSSCVICMITTRPVLFGSPHRSVVDGSDLPSQHYRNVKARIRVQGPSGTSSQLHRASTDASEIRAITCVRAEKNYTKLALHYTRGFSGQRGSTTSSGPHRPSLYGQWHRGHPYPYASRDGHHRDVKVIVPNRGSWKISPLIPASFPLY